MKPFQYFSIILWKLCINWFEKKKFLYINHNYLAYIFTYTEKLFLVKQPTTLDKSPKVTMQMKPRRVELSSEKLIAIYGGLKIFFHKNCIPD